ncbi:uncharacterized protein EV422DRAFT_407435 [Fimicolochytrium jonesii]|uniref:uncharacterized protein n=1 Tax=Fimicolochytrium jonesii TaxID=1396493 RepID=UPI0022FE6896|nr:uncharacterized protein EV422DRAFT_407435 [Fimicolochytrium jonesii]KAI8822624.1 hypothetical protein EV422DRAFT_407435 [Fimicolochytrium jonesii]
MPPLPSTSSTSSSPSASPALVKPALKHSRWLNLCTHMHTHSAAATGTSTTGTPTCTTPGTVHTIIAGQRGLTFTPSRSPSSKAALACLLNFPADPADNHQRRGVHNEGLPHPNRVPMQLGGPGKEGSRAPFCVYIWAHWRTTAGSQWDETSYHGWELYIGVVRGCHCAEVIGVTIRQRYAERRRRCAGPAGREQEMGDMVAHKRKRLPAPSRKTP